MQTPQAVTAMDIELTVNGERVVRRVPVRQNLADFLRDTLGLTGTHVGCEHGVCGACTVRCDGAIVRACLMLAVQADGTDIVTIEGAASAGDNAEVMAELQREFHQRNALQCGFCTPAMLLTAAELVMRRPQADREEIRAHLSGNYCRCTGYQSIVDAVEAVCLVRKSS
jgi:aerobic-type carbon monoxide dehydrogenase small subunit (CoxS/CutS family)